MIGLDSFIDISLSLSFSLCPDLYRTPFSDDRVYRYTHGLLLLHSSAELDVVNN
jgi:hypothetical protein